jgi:hypothetical protein
MSDAVQRLEAELTDQPKNPWRPPQTLEYQEERERLAKFVHAPPYVPGNRGDATARLRSLDTMIRDQMPRKIDDPLRANRVHQLAKEVLDTEIKPKLLPRAQMRRNPAGAVDYFRRTEMSKPFKRAVQAFKRAMFGLDPTTDDHDHANIERYRSEGGVEGTSTVMVGAQIPGHFALTPQAKENWPLGDATATSALEQVRKAEERAAGMVRQKAGLRAARVSGGATSARHNWTPEQRAAWGEKMRLSRLAKKAAQGDV